jgi:HTH-type transcriptional regulator / antitoxin HigA
MQRVQLSCGGRKVEQAVLDVEAILKAWEPFKRALGVAGVRTADDYTRARAAREALLKQIGDEEDHVLAEVLNFVECGIKNYEDALFILPRPGEVLRFLMSQQGLEPADLADCASAEEIAAFLAGKRRIDADTGRKLAARLGVVAELFL